MTEKFQLGQIFCTGGALDALEEAKEIPARYLMRHVSGDWGDIGMDDCKQNDHALTNGDRILSRYDLPIRKRIWIITEADRSATTILLPEEY